MARERSRLSLNVVFHLNAPIELFLYADVSIIYEHLSAAEWVLVSR
jgi:hypothetical protein